MRIGLDARSITDNKCGTSTAAECLIQALAANDETNEYVLYTDPRKKHKITNSPNFNEKAVSFKRYSIREYMFFGSILRQDRIDIFHSLHSVFPLGLPKGIKTVLSVMDLFSAKHSWFFEKYGIFLKEAARSYFYFLFSKSLEAANVVIAISKYTKDDIINTFSVSADKVKVLYLAAAPNPFFSLEEKDKAEKVRIFKKDTGMWNPYILFLGNFKKYKNIEGMLRAFAIMKRESALADLKLVIGGNDKKNSGKVVSLASELGIMRDICFWGYVKESDLPLLYAGARAFVFPSICEGFGIPPLEAMACGTPVVVSRTGSLPEVVGDEALTFDPYDSEDIAHTVKKVLDDDLLREKLIKYGLERYRVFSWDKTAKECLEIYEQLLNPGRRCA